jgi:hypothetical protein
VKKPGCHAFKHKIFIKQKIAGKFSPTSIIQRNYPQPDFVLLIILVKLISLSAVENSEAFLFKGKIRRLKSLIAPKLSYKKCRI